MKTKKKILVFIDWFLPGYKAGGPIRSCANMIDHLKDDFDFYVITRNTDYCEHTPYKDIAYNTWVKRENHLHIYYLSAENVNGKTIKKMLKETKFDRVYLNGVYSFYFTILPLWYLKASKVKILLASRGMLSDHAIAVKSFKKKLFIFFAKIMGLFRHVTFHATSIQEASEIKKNFSQDAIIAVVPNLPKTQTTAYTAKRKEKGKINFISIGRIAPEKNTLFALQLLAKQEEGEICLDIFGAIYNQEYFNACERLVQKFPKNISVNFHGSVGEFEINRALEKAHFLLLPSTGENFGHAILESLSAGVPIIISDKTPWRNLTEKNVGWDIDLKDEKQFLTVLKACVLMDQEMYDAKAKMAFSLAKKFIEEEENIISNKKMFLA